jgi:hypothetical protein
MDSVSFAMAHRGTGHSTATVGALIDITMSLITKFSFILAVLDDIHECDDFSFVLQHLNLLLQSPGCGAIFVGRPAVDSSRDICVVHPSNEDAIRTYLFPRAEELQDEDELDTSITPRYSQHLDTAVRFDVPLVYAPDEVSSTCGVEPRGLTHGH